MLRLSPFLLTLTWIIVASMFSPRPLSATDRVIEFTNGLWFRDGSFVEDLFYSVDGVLTRQRPASVNEVIDLQGKFIIPPFAEAHNHNIDNPPRPNQLKQYEDSGIFHVMIQNNIGPIEPAVATVSESPVEVVFANGGLTASDGHVVEMFTRLARQGVLGPLKENDLDGRAFFVIDSEADLENKWPAVLAGNPDFIKVFLGYAANEPAFEGNLLNGKQGLSRQIIPAVVDRAHEAGLRVSAHIETADDFRLAVDCGVDIIAHIPGWQLLTEKDEQQPKLARWMLDDETAKLAAERKTIVVTTVLAGGTVADSAHSDYQSTRRIHTHNLELLKQNGVNLVIGSDYYAGTSIHEAMLLCKQDNVQGAEPLGIFDNSELLTAWCTNTPRAIFPERKIGQLDEGFEASFLVLEKNPIDDISAVQQIDIQVKQGQVLTTTGK